MPHDDVPAPASTTRWAATASPRGDDYDRRWDELSAAGHDAHGEATFVMRFAPLTVLDAGCGTGRVARELARRGVHTLGVDADAAMLATAARKAPGLRWHCADLATLDLPNPDASGDPLLFEVVVLAGNVMIFLAPGTEPAVLRRVAAHTVPGGHVLAGFQIPVGGHDLATYDAHAAAAGLTLVERWTTWGCAPFEPTAADYAVSVHRREPT